jgi:hypothetical protein
MRNLTKAQSAAIASVAETVIALLLYLVHLIVAGTFVLPPTILAVLLPLVPTIDVLGTWALHGFATGDWTLPLVPTHPQPSPTPITPPQPTPIVPPTPPAGG